MRFKCLYWSNDFLSVETFRSDNNKMCFLFYFKEMSGGKKFILIERLNLWSESGAWVTLPELQLLIMKNSELIV